MNTAASTTVIAMTAPVIWLHRLARGFLRREALLGHDAFDVLDHHDRVVDHDADRQHHAEQTQLVDREAETRTCRGTCRAARPGITSVGISVARKFCRKISITRNTSTIASTRRLDHFLDRDADEGRSCRRAKTTPRPAGSCGCNCVHARLHRVGDAQCVGAGPSCTAKPAAGWSFHCSVEAVAPRAETRRARHPSGARWCRRLLVRSMMLLELLRAC